MACPTCDRTMQSVAHKVFWCPNCGTLRMADLKFGDHIPSLVERVRRKWGACDEHVRDCLSVPRLLREP